MDVILSVIGVAFSATSLVLSLTAAETRVRVKITAVLLSLSVTGILGTLTVGTWTEQRRINRTKEDVMRLFSDNNPLSFDQVFADLNYEGYSDVATAVDALLEDRLIHQRPVEVTSASGNKYVVRVYNSINFPIP
jgi:Clp protease